MAVLSGNSGLVYYGNAMNISAATKANPCSLTVTGHGFSTGERITIAGVGGMTQLNGNSYTITVVDANTFTLNGTDSSAYGIYTSGGTAQRLIEIIDWNASKTAKIANVTDSSSTVWEDHIAAGFQNFTGTISGFLKSSITKPAMGTVFKFTLYESPTVFIQGNGILTSDATALVVDGTTAVKVTWNFQGTSSLSETNP